MSTQREGVTKRQARTGTRPPATVRERLLDRIEADERRIDLEGVSTAYLEAGDGPPVVILHGAGHFAATWIRVIPRLASKNRVIVPDLPGQGASEIDDGGLDATRVLSWLDAFVDATCDSAPVLVGSHLGGAVAARFAAADDRRIARLALVDSFGLGPFRPAPRFALAMVGFMARPNERTRDRMLGACMVDIGGVRDQMGEGWELIATYALELARTPSVKAAGRKLMKEFGVPRIAHEQLERISVPTTLIWGRHDPETRLRVGEAASARFNWPLQVIEDCGADPHIERPAELVASLRKFIGGR